MQLWVSAWAYVIVLLQFPQNVALGNNVTKYQNQNVCIQCQLKQLYKMRLELRLPLMIINLSLIL